MRKVFPRLASIKTIALNASNQEKNGLYLVHLKLLIIPTKSIHLMLQIIILKIQKKYLMITNTAMTMRSKRAIILHQSRKKTNDCCAKINHFNMQMHTVTDHFHTHHTKVRAEIKPNYKAIVLLGNA